MTPAELISARRTLGVKAAELGRRLELEGRDPGRYIRLWETETHPIPGPVAVAVRFMLQEKARQGLQEAVTQAQAILAPPASASPALEPLRPPPVTTRRRG